MLSEEYRRPWKVWPSAVWARRAVGFLVLVLFFVSMFYALDRGSSRQLITLLLNQKFPFEIVLLEGAAGFSGSERGRLEQARAQGTSLGMFLLTGVNIADARTFFLSYFSPPPQGPAWLSWAYHPDDPEQEGPILEPFDQEPKPPSLVSPGHPDPKKVLVGIYHTHNSESYSGDGGNEHESGINGDVVKVGAALAKALENKQIGAVHSERIHDAQDFMKSYGESVKTAQALLEDYPTIKILLDIHRDGVPPGISKSTVNIGGREVSKVLIVIGKKNPDWEKNEEMARELIEIATKKYPGLFVPAISYASDARYNQHLSEGALLLEFGSQQNTLKEAEGTADLVADVLVEWLKQQVLGVKW
ncbi:stage II sporulation protein P [Paradesulfitobacterium aromaticivorans]